jgi:DNA-binding PadR family transcriptional regulator
MRTKTTVKPEMAILFVLAEHSEFEQYKLPKETSISYRTILRFLKPMEKADWIHLVRTEASEKGGKERKIYELTLNGLILMLKKSAEQYSFISFDKDHKKTNRAIEDLIDQVATIHKGMLPLIFGKWGFFIESDVKHIVVKRFLSAIRSSQLLPSLNGVREMDQELSNIRIGKTKKQEEEVKELYGEIEGRKKIKEIQERHIRILKGLKELCESRVSKGMRDLHDTTFGILSVGFKNEGFKDEGEESMFLLQLLRKDVELKAYLDNEFNEIEKEYTQYLANLKSWKQELGIS